MSLPRSNGTREYSLVSVSLVSGLILALAMGAAGCNSRDEIAGPEPGPSDPRPELLGSAIQLRVDMKAGNISVVKTSGAESQATRAVSKPSFALLGQNEVTAKAGPMTRSAVGEFTRNRVRVTFELTITNNLKHSDLVAGTFPTPPVNEVVAFPFATDPSGLFGLKVLASPDWDIAPHNFFNDGVCLGLPTPPADCFRSEAFGTTLQSGYSATRRVGFDVDPSITTFTVYVVMAADIGERPVLPQLGGLTGLVTSPQLGPLAGITVNVAPDATSAVTAATGAFTITALPIGSKTVSLSGLPSLCSDPGPQTTAVTSGGVAAIGFSVTCTARLIALSSGNLDGNAEIYTIGADGNGLRRLTINPASDGQPRWSPNGAKIAFVSDREGGPDGIKEIYVMSSDGSGQTRLTTVDGFNFDPQWSPDGTRIAFSNFVGGGIGPAVFLMNADGSGQTRLTERGTLGAQWSPDGTKIAFEGARNGNAEILVINADGTGETNLTNSPTRDATPVWSPDGARIVFVSADNNASPTRINVMNFDGTDRTELTNIGNNDHPQWSPDGMRIAFESTRDGNNEIYVMTAAGDLQTRLTNDPHEDHSPQWSPDGTKLLFLRNRGLPPTDELIVMNTDGSSPSSLTPGFAAGDSQWRPTWP